MADERHSDWITAELRRAATTERAPTHLRLRIDEMSRQRSGRPARRFVLVSATGALAGLVVVLILALAGGTPGAPTVAQAAVISVSSMPARASGSVAPSVRATKEYASFAAIRFPAELDGGTWTFVASHIARVGGRRMLVIDYTHAHQTIAYAIVATPLLRGQTAGFTSLRIAGRTVVSWQESDHSCLLSSATVPRSTLLTLARS